MGKIWNFISSASHSRTTAVLVILILFASVPLTVFVAQKQQQTKQYADGTSVYLAVKNTDGSVAAYVNQFTGTAYVPKDFDKIPGGIPKDTTGFDPTVPNQGPIVNNGTNPLYPREGGPANNIVIPQDPNATAVNLSQSICPHKTAYCNGGQLCVDQVGTDPQGNPACKIGICTTCTAGQGCQENSGGGATCPTADPCLNNYNAATNPSGEQCQQAPCLSGWTQNARMCNAPTMCCTAPTTITCTASPNPANINQNVTFTGNGGANTYTWSFPNGTPPNGTGKSFQTSYSTAENYNASMTDSSINKTIQCPITVSNGTPLTLIIGLDGIGSIGDRINQVAPSPFKTPIALKQTIPAFIRISDNKIDIVSKIPTSLIYDATSGKYKGTANIPSSVTGTHDIRIEAPNHLIKKLGVTTDAAQTLSGNLFAGDIDGNNSIDLFDYKILVGCWFPNKNNGQTACGIHQQDADINGDGVVDQIDYNLFLREYSVQNGD